MADGLDDWLSDPLRRRAERTPDQLALVDASTDDVWSYAEFETLVDETAIALANQDVGAGDTVATLFNTRPLAVALLFATMRRGATLAPLNVELDDATLADQLSRLEPAALLCDADTEQPALTAFDGHVASVDATAADGIAAFESTVDRPADVDRAVDGTLQATDAADRTALVAFTSGTTGRPKGVRLTMENLLASAVASAQRLGVTPRDRWLSPLSTYHVGGIAPALRSTLYGTTTILQHEFDADATAAALVEYDATSASFVPTMLDRVLDAGWRPSENFRFVLLGGGPAPESLLDRCLALDVPVCPTYGTTETASQIATATPGDTVDRPGTVGKPLHSAEVRIEDDGAPCAVGEVGELLVSGPMVSPGYLDPVATEQSFVGGALRTGDRGYRDADGRLWIVGRADDVIVTGGENVQPATIEGGLREHESVDDVSVVGVPDEEWGERIAALVVQATAVDAATLREHVRGRVPDYAVPKTIAFADELPRTPSGTVDRGAVRDRFE